MPFLYVYVSFFSILFKKIFCLNRLLQCFCQINFKESQRKTANWIFYTKFRRKRIGKELLGVLHKGECCWFLCMRLKVLWIGRTNRNKRKKKLNFVKLIKLNFLFVLHTHTHTLCLQCKNLGLKKWIMSLVRIVDGKVKNKEKKWAATSLNQNKKKKNRVRKMFLMQ